MSTYIISNTDVIFNNCNREGNNKNKSLFNDTLDITFINNSNSEGSKNDKYIINNLFL